MAEREKERAASLRDMVGEYPDISDLASRLRFSANEGRIWLDDMRMILMHVSGLAALRRELISKLGTAPASDLLFRIGYASGSADAVLVRKVRPERTPFESFVVGPQLHMLEGIAKVEPVHLSFDIEKGEYEGEFIWRDSAEADAHLSVYGVGSESSCWMQLGYATGYTSAFMGRSILYREVECRAAGHANCRIVGRPDHQWADDVRAKSSISLAGLRSLPVGTGLVARSNGASRPGVTAALPIGAGATAAAGGGSGTQQAFVGMSPAFVAALHRLEKVAPTSTTVLLSGETGVGKERFARRLHEMSPRAKGPFVAVNCSAIPKELIEAELFGVMRGAFTGATESRAGRFERAQGGSLFLDELGTLSRAAQAKLLRALQERQIERVGGTAPVDVDVRVITATNEDLKAQMRRGRFRADLYYRVAVFPIRVPTLRERRADIPPLIEHFVLHFAALHGKSVPGLSARAVNALLDHDYPGNVRELENMVERAVILGRGGHPLDVGDFFEAEEELHPRYLMVNRHGELAPAGDSRDESSTEPVSELDELVGRALESKIPLAGFEARLLEGAVARANGNLSLAAKSLGLTRPQLAYRLKKLAEDGG